MLAIGLRAMTREHESQWGITNSLILVRGAFMPDPAAHVDPPLTAEQIHTIVRRAFGADASLREVIPVGGGTVNEVWRLVIAGQLDTILRVAPSADAVASGPSWLTDEGLRREQAAIALLPTLAEILPRTVYFDTMRTIVPRDWVIQSIVPGVPWSEIDDRLTDEERIDLWRQLGTVCRAIHDVHGPAFGAVHAPGFATWAALLLDDARGLRSDARRFAIDVGPFDRLIEALEQHRGALDRMTVPSLIHSDLGPRHCFVEQDADGGWQIVGLIDLEFARFADPLSESVIELFDLMPPDERFRTAFWAGYGAPVALPEAEIRAALSCAIALGWVATDLARQERHNDVPEILAQLDTRLAVLRATAGKSEDAFGG